MTGYMPPVFDVNKPLPKHPSYDSDRTARAFWRASYRCGRRYLLGKDAIGEAVLVRHEREKDDSYARRLKVTKPRNHCGPIVRKYNDFVFRRDATGRDGTGLYATILADADSHGTPLVAFMRRALKRAQIEREAFILPDSTKPAGKTMNRPQAEAAKVRPFLRLIGADSVIWWRNVDGVLTEALLLLVNPEGEQFGRWMGPESTLDVALKQDETLGPVVASAPGEPVAHSYGACPLVRLRPLFDDADEESDGGGESQIAPLAELQQDVANKLSLLDCELYDSTFTQWIASGVDKSRVGELEMGSTRIICLPDPASKFDRVGADPAQAETISHAIADTQRELYRIAGISTGDPTASPGAPESGVARAFKFNDLAANLSALADACEDAENGAMDRLFAGQDAGEAPEVDYPGDFDAPEFASELETVIRVSAATGLPATIKRQVAQRFADRNLALDDAEAATFDDELAAIGVSDVNADPFNPAARMSGT